MRQVSTTRYSSGWPIQACAAALPAGQDSKPGADRSSTQAAKRWSLKVPKLRSASADCMSAVAALPRCWHAARPESIALSNSMLQRSGAWQRRPIRCWAAVAGSQMTH